MRSIRAQLGRLTRKSSRPRSALLSPKPHPDRRGRWVRSELRCRAAAPRRPPPRRGRQNPSSLPFAAGTSFNQQAKRAVIGIISGKLSPGAQHLIDDDTELHVDQIVVGASKECRPLVAPGHCAADWTVRRTSHNLAGDAHAVSWRVQIESGVLAGIVAASQWCSHACSQATGNFLEDGQILFLYRACPILKAANVIYLFIPHILEHLTSES